MNIAESDGIRRTVWRRRMAGWKEFRQILPATLDACQASLCGFGQCPSERDARIRMGPAPAMRTRKQRGTCGFGYGTSDGWDAGRDVKFRSSTSSPARWILRTSSRPAGSPRSEIGGGAVSRSRDASPTNPISATIPRTRALSLHPCHCQRRRISLDHLAQRVAKGLEPGISRC